MISLKQVLRTLFLGGWAVVATVGGAAAQEDAEQMPEPRQNTRAEWNRRVVAARPAYQDAPRYVPDTYPSEPRTQPAARQRRSSGRGYARPVAYEAEPDVLTQDMLPAPGPNGQMRNGGAVSPRAAAPKAPAPVAQPETQLGPVPMLPGEGPVAYGPEYEGPVFGDRCGGACCPGGGATWCGDGVCCEGDFSSLRNFAVFGGVHAYKGPLDLGQNANFGVHEGVLWGGPFGGLLTNDGPREIGWEVGLMGTHSDFTGERTLGSFRSASRNQFFLTAGIFRRPVCGGLQWGVGVDFLHDEFYNNVDFTQVRADVALVSDGPGELGFWGAFSTDRQTVRTVNSTSTTNNAGTTTTTTTPVFADARSLDIYCGYYRHRFDEGGEARAYGGFTNASDGIVGADLRVPLSRSFALENAVQYLIPAEGSSAAGQGRESWNLTMNLVWYPGRSARCVYSSPYRPVLPVADNSTFIIDRR